MSDNRDIREKLKEKMGRPGKDEILEGDILSVMFKLSWPVMIATFLRTLYNLVDTLWLGRLPGEIADLSVSAASQAWSVVFIIMSLEVGLGMAGLALVAQYTGRKEYDKAEEFAGQLYFIIIVLSIVLAIIGYLSSPYILELLTGQGAQAEALADYGTRYLQIIFLGMPFMFLFFAFIFILRGYGDNITPLRIVIVTLFLNMILDPILIFGSGTMFSIGSFSFTMPTFFGYSIPRMGIEGAAYATIGTRALGAVYSFYLMFSGKLDLDLKFSYMYPDIKKIKKYLKIGLPASAGRVSTGLGFFVLWAIIYRLPNPATAGAAYGAGSRILQIMFLVMSGVTMAISVMVGQSLGADMVERSEKVAKKGLLTLAILMGILAVLMFLFSNVLISFMVPGRDEVISSGAEYLMIFSLSMPFLGIFRGITRIMAGSGHTVQQMSLDLSRTVGLKLTLAFVLSMILGMNSTGVYLGIALSNIIGAGAAFVLYSKGWWKEKVISESTVPGTAGAGVSVGGVIDEDESDD